MRGRRRECDMEHSSDQGIQLSCSGLPQVSKYIPSLIHSLPHIHSLTHALPSTLTHLAGVVGELSTA